MRYLLILPLLILPLALTACDGVADDEPDLAVATFEATLQGALDVRLRGEAWLVESPLFNVPSLDELDGPSREFTATMISLDASAEGGAIHGIMISFFGDEPPAPGSYEIAESALDALTDSLDGFFVRSNQVPGGAPLVTYIVAKADQYTTYLLAAGTVEITEASNKQVAGTFAMEAEQIAVYSAEDLQVPTWGPVPDPFGRAPFEQEVERLETPLRVTGTFRASQRESLPAGR